MAKIAPMDGLEIEQDSAFQRRSWFVERVGWAGLALIVGAALAGLVGPGPLSRTSAGSPGLPLELEYDRYVRSHNQTDLQVRIEPDSGLGRARLWLDVAYLERVRLDGVEPEPAAVLALPERTVFEFRTGSDRPVAITFRVIPLRAGSVAGRLGLADGRYLTIRQFTYP